MTTRHPASIRARTAPMVAAALLVCSHASAGLMLVSEKEEIQIGKQVAAQSEKEYGGVLHDARRQARLNRVVAKIHAQRQRKNIPYTFKILNDDKVINAFAAPGGPLYITKKLFDMCETDGKLAFIVGHEFAHTELQHGRKAINKAVIAQAGFQILLGKSSEAVKLGVGIAWNIIESGYSRDQERDADAWGVRYVVNGGWDPYEAVRALEMLGGGKHSGLSKYFSSHPATPERVQLVKQQIATEFPAKVRPGGQPAAAAATKPQTPQKPPSPTKPTPPTDRERFNPSPVRGQQGYVIASDPGGAEVWIDGRLAGSTLASPAGTLSQPRFFPAAVGSHSVVVKKAGAGDWEAAAGDRTVRKGEGRRLSATLGRRARATFRVDSAPRPVFSIEVGGKRVCRGSGPGTLVLPRGNRTKIRVTVRMDYRQANGWISIPDQEAVSFSLRVRGSSVEARQE